MVENILRVESECEIIKPTIIKRRNYRLFESNQFLENTNDDNIYNDISIKKKGKPNINISNKSSKEQNNYFPISQKSKKDYFTFEILKILNQPINNINSMNRYILEKDKSEIFNSEENNNIEMASINKFDFDYSF